MKIRTVTGGTLFRIALEELGDATQWDRIARMNGLTDPVLSGTLTLMIPDTGTSTTGGILGAG